MNIGNLPVPPRSNVVDIAYSQNIKQNALHILQDYPAELIFYYLQKALLLKPDEESKRKLIRSKLTINDHEQSKKIKHLVNILLVQRGLFTTSITRSASLLIFHHTISGPLMHEFDEQGNIHFDRIGLHGRYLKIGISLHLPSIPKNVIKQILKYATELKLKNGKLCLGKYSMSLLQLANG